MDKDILGIIASILVLWAYLPYIWQIIQQKFKPHIFTWITWTLMSTVACIAQIVSGAGAGSWPTGIVVIISSVITVLSFKYGEKNITCSDWYMFLGGLSALPAWWITKDPTLSVLIVTFIDSLAFGPTIRKSWHKPFEEPLLMYGIHTIRHTFSFLAVASYSIASAAFPFTMIFMNLITGVLIFYRRRVTTQ
jgi:hypothetical protein